MGIVVQVWFQRHAERNPDKSYYELLETDHESFTDFLDDVASGGMIPVTVLHTKPGDVRGVRHIVARQTGAVRGTAIDRMQLSTYRIMEAE